jgi:hypothetical protein
MALAPMIAARCALLVPRCCYRLTGAPQSEVRRFFVGEITTSQPAPAGWIRQHDACHDYESSTQERAG